MIDRNADRAATPTAAISRLAGGVGWRVSDVVCTAGPQHRPFEERHDAVSIAVVVAGSFAYRSTHGAVALVPGALMLGNVGQFFECGHEHAVGDRCIAFNYATEAFAEIAAATPGVTHDDFRCHRIPPVTAAMELVAASAAAAQDGCDAAGWEEIALTIASRALLLIADRPRSERRPSVRDTKRITDAARLIEARYAESLPLGALAAACGMSRYHFLRLFRQVVGVTPHQYLLRTRLHHAAISLRSGAASVTGLAFELGFGDLSTFNALFRRSFGVSPSAYRARSVGG
ncbi:MAG TPA: AraC family transcriptional regulator [Stellaceae bacterium]|nr:AraC family transcriptional regulator [Stellaceae bacterium]